MGRVAATLTFVVLQHNTVGSMLVRAFRSLPAFGATGALVLLLAAAASAQQPAPAKPVVLHALGAIPESEDDLAAVPRTPAYRAFLSLPGNHFRRPGVLVGPRGPLPR